MKMWHHSQQLLDHPLAHYITVHAWLRDSRLQIAMQFTQLWRTKPKLRCLKEAPFNIWHTLSFDMHLRFFTLWMTLTCVINRVIIIIIIIWHKDALSNWQHKTYLWVYLLAFFKSHISWVDTAAYVTHEAVFTSSRRWHKPRSHGARHPHPVHIMLAGQTESLVGKFPTSSYGKMSCHVLQAVAEVQQKFSKLSS